MIYHSQKNGMAKYLLCHQKKLQNHAPKEVKLMLETVRISAMQVSMLFVLIAVGVVLRRTHVFEGKGITCVTDILFYIISPCIIIDRLVGTVSDNGEAAFKILGWSALATCVASRQDSGAIRNEKHSMPYL